MKIYFASDYVPVRREIPAAGNLLELLAVDSVFHLGNGYELFPLSFEKNLIHADKLSDHHGD